MQESGPAVPGGRCSPAVWGRSRGVAPIIVAWVAFVLGVSLAPTSSRAQEERKHKVPVLSSGGGRQAFTGKLGSLDLKRKILHVNTVQGEDTEIFEVGKGVRVASADGEKLKLNSLLPGTNVLIYFEQKGDQRTVKEIIVLAAGPAEAKKPSPPS